jgi:hypothetical protein
MRSIQGLLTGYPDPKDGRNELRIGSIHDREPERRDERIGNGIFLEKQQMRETAIHRTFAKQIG